MIKSMTGFAHIEFATAGIGGSLEIRSYNNRYFDISITVPSWLSSLEPRIRAFMSERMSHGKVEFLLRARSLEVPVKATADLAAARSVAAALRDIAMAAGIDEPIRLSNLMAVEGVLVFEREIEEEKVWHSIEPSLGRVFADFDRSRIEEGRALERDVMANLARIEQGQLGIRKLVPEIEATLRRQVGERFAEILGEAASESRMLSEVASLLMKYTINEEVVRLGAHLVSFGKILGSQAAPAKKLDFLCQEINREVNTIGSKNMLLPVSEIVVDLKDAIENIREQLRNIE
ncbi:MAG: YicC/YloC family endoribonuclease [Spirochaetota bacterium]